MVAELWFNDGKIGWYFCENCGESLRMKEQCEISFECADVLWMLECPTSTIGRDQRS